MGLDEFLEAYINPSIKVVARISLVPSVVNSLLSPSSAIVVIKLYSLFKMCVYLQPGTFIHIFSLI